MREAGWSPEENAQGLLFRVPPEQQEALDRATAQCEESIGIPEPRPLAADELRELYALNLETQACLEAEGFELPDPPTLGAFLEDQNLWVPYINVIEQVNEYDAWIRLNEVCPQTFYVPGWG